jgi:hypothetical protein
MPGSHLADELSRLLLAQLVEAVGGEGLEQRVNAHVARVCLGLEHLPQPRR